MRNNWFTPSFYDYDEDNDGSYYYMSPMQYERLRRQEAANRRRRMEEMEYMRQLEEEQAYRRKLAKLRAAEQKQLRAQRAMPTRYQIVQGLDGRYYRIPVERDDDEPQDRENTFVYEHSPRSGKNQKLEDKGQSYVLGPDGYLYRVSVPSDDILSTTEDQNDEKIPLANTNIRRPMRRASRQHQTAHILESVEPTNPVNKTDDPKLSNAEKRMTARHLSRKPSTKSGIGKKKVTVIVEDASDSENDDDFKSIWRNRRPSPGEWMEPVEYQI